MPTINWTELDRFKDRLGIATCDKDAMLVGILAGVERTIQTAIASPVALTFVPGEWRAPTDDPRLVLKWRPVNVLDAPSGTANPVVNVCETSYDLTTGTALVYGTDYVVYGVGDNDTRFSLTPILRGVNRTWGYWGSPFGWGSVWCRPPERLSSTRTSDLGRVNVAYWAGWPTDAIPETIVEAAYLEAATLYYMRKFGRFLSSESLNGYSYSTAPIPQPIPGTTVKFMSGAAAAMLAEYIMPVVGGGVEPW